MGKKKGKPVLMPPFDIKWPKVNNDTEQKIITALTSKLQQFPSLENRKGKESRRQSESSPLPRPDVTPQELEQGKARLRQQVVIGFRQVTKCLEWRQLSLVVVSGQTQPPVLLQSLLLLAAERGCPALCLASLRPWLPAALGIDNILALGFKKAQPNMHNDFGEFVAMATALAPPLELPGTHRRAAGSSAGSAGDGTTEGSATGNSTAGGGGGSAPGGSAGSISDAGGAPSVEGSAGSISDAGGAPSVERSDAQTSETVQHWPVMEAEQEKMVMDKLLELLEPHRAVLQTPRSRQTAQGLQTRRCLNSVLLMDLGAVRQAAQSSQLTLLLVHHEDSAPCHPIVTFALSAATHNSCPVLHLGSLRSRLSAIVQGIHIHAVGFKKSQTAMAQQFQPFVSMATEYVHAHLRPAAISQSEDSCAGQAGESTQSNKGAVGPAGESSQSGSWQKPPPPVYDVSDVYVYKTDGDKNIPLSDMEAQPGASSVTESYLSLSSEPTVEYLGVKSLSDDTLLPGAAFLDSRSSGVAGKSLMAGKPQTSETGASVETGAQFAGVMGLDAMETAVVTPPLVHAPRAQKLASNLKRALDQSADRGEFVSFKIRRADIAVSLANPSKTRKHKKGRRK